MRAANGGLATGDKIESMEEILNALEEHPRISVPVRSYVP